MSIGVGMPSWMYLNLFGRVVFDAFGEWPYLVGSAATSKQWRDVDVRLILDDAEYERIFGAFEGAYDLNPKWVAFCMAFSELGKRITGLPIDFQIDQRSRANDLHKEGRRHALIGCSEVVRQQK